MGKNSKDYNRNISINEESIKKAISDVLISMQKQQKITHKELVKMAGLHDELIASAKKKEFDFSMHEFITMCENLNIKYKIVIEDEVCAYNGDD